MKEFDYSSRHTALQKELLKQTEEKINLIGLITTTEKENHEKVIIRSKIPKQIIFNKVSKQNY